MNKLYIFSSMAVVILLVVSGGCNTTTPTTTTPTITTPTIETPSSIETELELTGNETYSLLAIYELEASATSKEVIVSGAVESLKFAKANGEMIAEFYDSSGTLIGTEYRDFILNGVLVLARIEFIIKFSNDSQSQIVKCKLIVRASE